MDRNDKLFLWSFLGVLAAIILTAFSPEGSSSASLGGRVWQVANSAITLTIVGTFVAAYAGTWGAVILGERSAKRREALAELRALNTALAFCFTITNTALLAKRDRIKPLVDKYDENSSLFEKYIERMRTPGPKPSLPFERLPMVALSTPLFPINQLEKVLSERINATSAFILFAKLAESISGLVEVLDRRNAWIAEVRSGTTIRDEEVQYAYFGHLSPSGKLDKSYNGFVRSLSAQTDHTIAFSILLTETLVRRANKISDKLNAGPRAIVSSNFQAAGDLLPEMRDYEGWVGVESSDEKTVTMGIRPK